jgi:CheY-like chemotaxis protein
LAVDGRDALSYLQINKYDLILLDLQMPYFDGLELLEIIKKEDAINQSAPVIAITAHAQSYQRKTLIDAGFDECLIKPILLEELTEIVNLWKVEPHSQNHAGSEHNLYLSAMLNKTKNDKPLANTIFKKLFTELPQQTQIIEMALSFNDLSLARQTTHKLHGSVSFCGFTDMQSKANDLENYLAENNHALISSSFLDLKNSITSLMSNKTIILDELMD